MTLRLTGERSNQLSYVRIKNGERFTITPLERVTLGFSFQYILKTSSPNVLD